MEALPLPPSGRSASRRGRKLASVLVALVVLGAWGWVGAKKEVKLVVDGKEQKIRTFARTVKDVLKEKNVALAKEDTVEPQLDSWLSRNATITIQRAFPITVEADGKMRTLMTVGCTVAQVLKLAGVAIGEDDAVTPSLEQTVEHGTQVVVVRREIKTIVEKEQIPFAVHRRRDPTLEQKKTRVLEPGTVGIVEKTYSITYENGKAGEKKLVSENVIQKPIDKIIMVGTKVPGGVVRTSRGLVRYRQKRSMTATAYIPRPKGGSGITATGIPARRGLVAVDPKVIPLNTRLYIPGYGFCVAADTGGLIRGERIDLCYETLKEAVRFGRRKIEVYILH